MEYQLNELKKKIKKKIHARNIDITVVSISEFQFTHGKLTLR